MIRAVFGAKLALSRLNSWISEVRIPVTRLCRAACKVEEVGGKLVPSPAWVSRDMKRGAPVLIVNGMIVGYGSGEETKQP